MKKHRLLLIGFCLIMASAGIVRAQEDPLLNIALPESASGKGEDAPKTEAKPLTNARIVSMVKSGVSDDKIIPLISQYPAKLDTGLEALIQLHEDGVSNAVIDAIKRYAPKTRQSAKNSGPAKKSNAANGKLKVAVLDFKTIGGTSDLGEGAAEILRTTLMDTGKYVVIERGLLKQVLEEQKLGLSGAVEPKTAVGIGKILGANLVAAGSVVKTGGTYTLNVRFVSVETGAVVFAKKLATQREGKIPDLCNQVVVMLSRGEASDMQDEPGFESSALGAEREAAPEKAKMMRWGTELAAGLWTMDGADFKKDKAWEEASALPGDTLSLKLQQGRLGGAFYVFAESEKKLGFGASLGFGLMPKVSYDFGGYILSDDITYNTIFTNKTTHIPADIYLKYRPKDAKYGIFGGFGADYVMVKTDVSIDGNRHGTDTVSARGSFTQNKIIPHVQAGGEYFVARWLSINAGIKYFFSGVMEDLTGDVTCTDNGGSSYMCTDPGTYKNRLIMVTDSTGEHSGFKKTSEPLISGERPFRYDFSGLRTNVSIRVYF